jgi:hypothetical protein
MNLRCERSIEMQQYAACASSNGEISPRYVAHCCQHTTAASSNIAYKVWCRLWADRRERRTPI